jgi:hypothetical protein
MAQPREVDRFVHQRPAPVDRPPMVRMSVDVPQALHRQIKAECATNGEKISDAVRELIETYWPKRKVHVDA